MNPTQQSPMPKSPTLIPLLDEQLRLQPLRELLATISPRVIACSGGIDSLLLATIAHRQNPATTVVAHALSPAVPTEATARVKEWALREGWNLQLVSSGEFQSEDYLSNPVNRCYHCKSHLYSSLEQLAANNTGGATLLSGANLDDLGEYRPGLIAAAENAVRHPYIEASIGKQMIRAIARHLHLPFAELPASPCLASRLYTGTRVTAERLKAIELGETLIRQSTGIEVVRCRIRENQMFIETGAADRERISSELLATICAAVRLVEPAIATVELDAEPYRSGRAFLVSQS
ncbi:ATPase [Pseudomonas sp. PDM31]|uniref:ATP-dependent sacrificial sulfur transferase LarE n=1 Tax=Pseudomonas sp. PDM31 TaxID=2854778 RepID=UPI001C458217|nr:ATPase [Pseudomonas sp. PDM31]MBV7477603.1 ATPase [Pseudomonas sp. PDM31]